mmetsp:Transcript_18277/g.40444  ORF Transcript_18277/g.40444 Transcript_18277/m.40444 type:complete len:683 (+) Transcript_18277:136-2184(+)
MRVVASLTLCAAATSVSPTAKVVQLLQGMLAKGKQEKQDEEISFAKFKQWCGATHDVKAHSVEKSKEMIAALEAEIGKLDADIGVLGKQISTLDQEVETHKVDKKASTEVRRQEASDYSATHADYSESLDAIGRAITTLKKMASQAEAQDALLQVAVTAKRFLPLAAQKGIMAFLQQEPDTVGAGVQAPEAATYESHSGGIVDMLEDLKNKFRSQLSDLEKEELNQKHDYEMMIQTLEDEIEAATKTSSRKAAEKADKQKRMAEAQGEKDEEESDLAADSKYLSDLDAECMNKSVDYESRQKTRADEINAIEQAVGILSSDSVAGAADRHLPSLVQLRKGKSLLQLRSVARNPAQDQAAAYLQEAAGRLGSSVLAQIATAASASPFLKVQRLIRDLIIKLKEEANEEAEHTGWCNTELTTNQQTRDRKSAQVDELSSNLDELHATIGKLAADVSDLQEGVAALQRAMAKAGADRTAEKAQNKATIKDAQDAQAAVRQAISVLKEYYATAAGNTALAQGPAEDAPETFSGAYKGMQGESTGVIGMLEVIESDFARLEADTKAEESEAEDSFKKFVGDSKTDKAVKETDMENKQGTITRKKQDVEQVSQELQGTQKELDAAMDYYDKLKPSCVSAGVNYDDRVKQREEEIQSLKEALKILRGDDIPMPIESGRPEYETGASFQE